MKNNFFTFISSTLLSVVFFSSTAIAIEKTIYNPHPLPDDLVLPMPDGAEMVFRPVIVPGANFWGDNKRIVELGTNIDDIFSARQRTLVNGSFPSKDGNNWLIWIAKYELTQGQYVAVMGEKSLLEKSGAEKNKKAGEAKYSELKGKELAREQSQPLVWVSYSTINEFLTAYNNWLFDPNHKERLENIPKIDGVPGFIRLPTEEEWEFSAKGGLEALEDGKFSGDFPFPANQLRKYAYTKGNKIKPISNKISPNPLGIFGMYGNVEEIVGGIFRPEMNQGKPGGIIVRGGSYNGGSAAANPALRKEMDLYRWDEDEKRMLESANYKTGTRLAIGSNVIPRRSYKTAVIEKDLETYLASVKQKTPVGERNQNFAGQATIQLGNIDDTLKKIIERYPDIAQEANTIQQNIDKASIQLDQAQYESARSVAQDASRNATNILELMYKAHYTEKFLSRESIDESVRRVYQHNLNENAYETELQLNGYLSKIEDLGQYEKKYISSAIEKLEKKKKPRKEEYGLILVNKHILYFENEHKVSKEKWLEDFKKSSEQFIAEKEKQGLITGE